MVREDLGSRRYLTVDLSMLDFLDPFVKYDFSILAFVSYWALVLEEKDLVFCAYRGL